jgi:hypothetical protein
MRLNFFVMFGVCFLLFRVFLTIIELFTGGLVGGAGIYGATLPSILLVVLGIILIKIGRGQRDSLDETLHGKSKSTSDEGFPALK